MVIVLKQNPDGNKVEQLMKRLRGMGLDIHQSQGKSSTILGLVGDTSSVDIDALNALEIVETVKRIQEPYKSANRKFHPEDSVIEVGGAKIGGGNFAVIAGPCSVESREQLCCVAADVKAAGATLLRGGAFKPRPPLTLSRGCAERESAFCWRQKKKPDCLSLRKSWICLNCICSTKWM